MSQATIHVLLIEDSVSDAFMIERMLSDAFESVEVSVCETLEEGLEVLRCLACSAVLLDYTLPDCDGLEAIQRIRAAGARAPIIMLTGSRDHTLGLKALKAGAQDYHIKDEISSNLLSRSIRYAIERATIEDELRRSREEYRSLIEDVFRSSNIGIFILNRELEVGWTNQTALDYFGLHEQELYGRSMRELIDGQIAPRLSNGDAFRQRALAAFDEGTLVSHFECHVQPALSSQERWLEYWSQSIHSGMFAGGRIEHFMDITEQKRIELAEAEQRQFERALRDTLQTITNTLDLDQVLDRVLENIEKVVPHHAAQVLLIEDGVARIVRTSGPDASPFTMRRDFSVEDYPAVAEAVRTRLPVTTQLPASACDYDADLPGDTVSFLGAPMLLHGEVKGMLTLFKFGGLEFTPREADRLKGFAKGAAIALQNAQLNASSRELAAVEERQRLARELHDSVSQALFSASVISEAGMRSIGSDPARTAELWPALHELTVGALAEMRILLLELRPGNMRDAALNDLITQLVQALRSRKEIAIELHQDGSPALELPVKLALYRIVQEALNNVAKHSHATHVRVLMTAGERDLDILIEDDGVGFSQDNVNGARMGLQIMRERAAEIDAELNVTSMPQAGTRIHVHYAYRPEPVETIYA